MNKYKYPAVFMPDEEEGGYTVVFPDLPGCITEGDTASEAFDYAKEALGGWMASYVNKNKSFPKVTPIEDIVLSPGEKIMLVEVDSVYLKEILNKTIKKTLTIPQWLNMAAEQRGVNMSAFLAKSLEKELDIKAP